MRDTMLHRGPDDAGLYIDPTRTVALGHRRLSIIDLSERGRQPLTNEDGSLVAVVNGEFYGYRAQRAELIARGHTLGSDSDSEVLLHLYEDAGLDAVRELRGMFGAALWDERRRRLVLLRDRVGKKPVYYAHTDGCFAFASELKALEWLPWVDRDIDPDALDGYLALGYVPGESSILRGVRRLGPGERLVYDETRDEVAVDRYWELPPVEGSMGEDEALGRLRTLLEESVALRLVSDVPVGVFLSGGIDSSVVACLAAQVSSEPLRTFTISFSEASHDESAYARLVAEHIGSDHHEIPLSIDMLDAMDLLPDMYGEPFADSSAIPTYYVSKATRGSVTVALAGDGGDELFGGYNWYEWVNRVQRLRTSLGPLSPLVAAAARATPPGTRGRSFATALSNDPAGVMADRTFFFSRAERAAIVREAYRPVREGVAESWLSEALRGDGDLLDAMERYDFGRYLPDDILVKVDRASMGVGLEVRAPLLDQEVCAFAFSLDASIRTAGGVKKGLLKRLAREIVPEALPLERKHGFSLPLSQWLRQGFGEDLVQRIQSTDRMREVVDVATARRMLEEHRSGRRDNTQRLWALAVLAVWLEARS